MAAVAPIDIGKRQGKIAFFQHTHAKSFSIDFQVFMNFMFFEKLGFFRKTCHTFGFLSH